MAYARYRNPRIYAHLLAAGRPVGAEESRGTMTQIPSGGSPSVPAFRRPQGQGPVPTWEILAPRWDGRLGLSTVHLHQRKRGLLQEHAKTARPAAFCDVLRPFRPTELLASNSARSKWAPSPKAGAPKRTKPGKRLYTDLLFPKPPTPAPVSGADSCRWAWAKRSRRLSLVLKLTCLGRYVFLGQWPPTMDPRATGQGFPAAGG